MSYIDIVGYNIHGLCRSKLWKHNVGPTSEEYIDRRLCELLDDVKNSRSFLFGGFVKTIQDYEDRRYSVLICVPQAAVPPISVLRKVGTTD
jgi:hypothetical protein